MRLSLTESSGPELRLACRSVIVCLRSLLFIAAPLRGLCFLLYISAAQEFPEFRAQTKNVRPLFGPNRNQD
jgi:hypothetical protein